MNRFLSLYALLAILVTISANVHANEGPKLEKLQKLIETIKSNRHEIKNFVKGGLSRCDWGYTGLFSCITIANVVLDALDHPYDKAVIIIKTYMDDLESKPEHFKHLTQDEIIQHALSEMIAHSANAAKNMDDLLRKSTIITKDNFYKWDRSEIINFQKKAYKLYMDHAQ